MSFWDNLDLQGVLQEGLSKSIDKVSGSALEKWGITDSNTETGSSQYAEQVIVKPVNKIDALNNIPNLPQNAVATPIAEKVNSGGVLVEKPESKTGLYIMAGLGVLSVIAVIAVTRK